MKRLTIGILAHVDAGKTTLSEAMLYHAGVLRKLGRVDHQDAFLDTDGLERERGITIFSKQAVLRRGELELTLLDTPGHVDFAAEMERTVQVLDYAILLVSGPDGVQGHTETLWRLLESHGVPTFLFLNKMDQPGVDRAALLEQLRQQLGEGCVDCSGSRQALMEQAALCDEGLLERYLEGEEPSEQELAGLIARRELFPCYFGSALHLDGVEWLLDGLERYTLEPDWGEAFAARVFKISRDERGERLTWLKVTGGSLRVRDAVRCGDWEEKVSQLRLYSGARFTPLDEAPAGTVCAATGLTQTRVGQGLGAERNWLGPELEPVLRYQVLPPDGCDGHTLLGYLRQLEEEDPQLRVEWDERTGAAQVHLMGEVHREILARLLERRFGVEAAFGPGAIVYRETIAGPVEGVGHFEPLRHYAEVHLLLEPLERGGGIVLDTACPEDALAGSWQRLILTHLAEKTHLGVLTGAPLTDVKITLLTGRAHTKHTEGGDFRQATYRAVRQGLRVAQSQGLCQLLEPWYHFTLRVPQENLGRALADMPRLCGEFDPPQTQGEEAVLTGRAPVACLRGYAREVSSYTRGRGQLACLPAGYAPCHNTEEAVAALGYDMDGDLENTADSVFCSHGAGFSVSWDKVPSYMHLPSVLARGERLARAAKEQEEAAQEQGPRTLEARAAAYRASLEQDKELMAIFERTYGPIKRDPLQAFRPVKKSPAKKSPAPYKAKPPKEGPEHLLVDGYNVIFSWEDLKALAAENLEAARHKLMDILCNFAAYRRCVAILVFDAYKVKGGVGSVEQYHNLHVVYTKEAETADMYIEKATHQIARRYHTRVVTSDATEQLIILGAGALRVSSLSFQKEVEQAQREIREILSSQ